MTDSLLNVALLAHQFGLCVLPPKEDGTKAPMIAWKEYSRRLSTETEIRQWYSNGRGGIGIICGQVSGGLEMLEFEGRAVEEGVWNDFKAECKAAGLSALLSRIQHGYGERTPSGGLHLLYRCPDGVEGNTKLAERLATPEELEADPKDRRRTLIETRGEGGYVIVAPTNGTVHPSGRAWQMLAGGFPSIADISGEERAQLFVIARSLDRIQRQEWTAPTNAEVSDLRPGDDFNARGDWAADVLEPAGWSRTAIRAGREHWYRSGGGQANWTSATITPDRQFLYVFSTSTELPSEVGLSKYRAYAFLHHAGDFAAAARALREKGYGGEEAGRIVHVTQEIEVTAPPRPKDPWPKAPDPAARYGLAGEVVELVTPYTEGDPTAVLGQFLALFGVAVGTRPHFEVGATRHTARIFVGVIGKSAKARKGDSWAPVERLMVQADPSLVPRILGGFGSGEALVHAVRDERYESDKDGRQKLVDLGVKDKRLLALETELARLLVAVNREGNTISQYVRDAFDGRPLRNLVKGSPAAASGHHIGIIGHSTGEELRGRLNEDQIRNGFANRFLWLAVQRSQLLPAPPPFRGPEIDMMISLIRRRLQKAREVDRMYYSEAAAELWRSLYEELASETTGTIGVLTERAEAIVLRLSMIYALTDGAEVILPEHLYAAMAMWGFSTRSVQYIFGGSTGSVISDRILDELEFGPMTSSELMIETFHKNIPAPVLYTALQKLVEAGLVVEERVKNTSGRGRPAVRWSKRP